MKEECKLGTVPPQAAVSRAVGKAVEYSGFQLPSTSSLKQMCRRSRRSAGGSIPEPVDLHQLSLTPLVTTLDNGTEFLLHDSGPGSDRVILFSTEMNMELLSRCTTIFSDGTFSTAPTNLFSQLYTVHGEISAGEEKTVVPLVYAFLPNKLQRTYERVLEVIREKVDINPRTWIVDFERGAINAIEKYWPNVTRGCYFHLQQSVYRKVVELGCKSNYENDSQFVHHIKCISALAFLPENEVEEGFRTLTNHSAFPVEATQIAGYFHKTYIGLNQADSSVGRPLFAVKFWNVNERTKNDDHRTNNQVEGWHRRFQSVLSCGNPGFFTCVKALKREQVNTTNKVNRLQAGFSVKKRKNKYIALNDRLKKIVEEREERTVMEFLRAIARNYT